MCTHHSACRNRGYTGPIRTPTSAGLGGERAAPCTFSQGQGVPGLCQPGRVMRLRQPWHNDRTPADPPERVAAPQVRQA
jgi:hypothetical protein